MKLTSLIARLRPRHQVQRRPLDTASLAVRDWADLPVYHPRSH
jgi:hypothetical protein